MDHLSWLNFTRQLVKEDLESCTEWFTSLSDPSDQFHAASCIQSFAQINLWLKTSDENPEYQINTPDQGESDPDETDLDNIPLEYLMQTSSILCICRNIIGKKLQPYPEYFAEIIVELEKIHLVATLFFERFCQREPRHIEIKINERIIMYYRSLNTLNFEQILIKDILKDLKILTRGKLDSMGLAFTSV